MVASEATNKPCARCGAALFHAELDGFGLEGCGVCGGVWLGNEGAADVMAGQVGPAARLAAQVAAKTRPSPALLARSASCPDCQRALAPVQTLGVRLDVCADHGAWFDRGEVEQLLRATKVAATPELRLHAQKGVPSADLYPWLRRFVVLCKVFAALALAVGLWMLLGDLGLLDKETKKVVVFAVFRTLFVTTVSVLSLLAAGNASQLLLDLADRPTVS
ncbi:MAG: zf-TFIIB domain-containing protein [Polyangiaceae bacterium]|nr:zf-TFIIB domain-containing protein [Polyangiaceae bacterium]